MEIDLGETGYQNVKWYTVVLGSITGDEWMDGYIVGIVW
jgi:hypothetical protein